MINKNEQNRIFYHYCSLDALYNIISSKSFWLTSLLATNDSTELKLAQKVLDEALKKMINDNCEHSNIIKKINDVPKNSSYRKPTNQYYSMCFVNDSDSLTHWDRYGNNGTGICIAVNVSLFDQLWHELNLSNIYDLWFWHSSLIYLEVEQHNFIKKELIKRINGYKASQHEAGYQDCFQEIPTIYTYLYNSIFAKCKPIFKHSGFQDEREYRIIFNATEIARQEKFFRQSENLLPQKPSQQISTEIRNTINTLNLKRKNRQYKLIGNSIRSLYSMNLSKIWSTAFIPEIIIGPKCYQNKKELKSFLIANGLDKTEIRVSQIPLR